MADAPPTVVLLGASNLTLGISHAIDAARAALGGPCRFLVAAGHGRSYVGGSRVLIRSLPGVLECGLWDALADREVGAAHALIMDIGNDVGYGHGAEAITAAVGEAVRRLRDCGAAPTIVDLPYERLKHLPAWRFELFRRLFFPGRPLRFDAMLEQVRRVQAGVRTLVPRPIHHAAHWYGFDPIHIRRRYRAEAFAHFLSPWGSGAEKSTTTPARLNWFRLRPERWWLLGRARRRAQPSVALPDGSTVALY